MPILLFILILCWGCASPAFADQAEPERTHSKVVVHGSRGGHSVTVPDYSKAKQQLAYTPGGTAIIHPEDYKKGRAATLQDALGYTAGVYIQPRFGAEESRLSIRGSGIQRTFHLRGIKLLQDGIPLNQADGGADFQTLDPSALQYTEVYRGANALQYGSTTLGGAINFVSHTGYTAPLIQGRVEAGGFNYFKSQLSSGEVIGPADYFISLSEYSQKGFRNHSDQDTKRLFSNYGLRLGDHAETRFYLDLVESKSKLPGNLTLAQMKQNPKQNNPANTAGNQKRDYDWVRVANKTAFEWGEQAFEAGAFYIHKDLFHPIFQVIDQVSHDFGAHFRYQNKEDLFGHRNFFTLGFTPVWNLVENTQHTNVGGSRGALTLKALQRAYNLDLYGEDQFYLTDTFALVGGMQASYASRKSLDKFLTDGDHSGHPTYSAWSPKLGMRYEFTELNQIFANFSRSFEPPSFGELSNVTGGGLRDITEQLANTVEFGTRGETGRFAWDAAYYYSWVENELLSLNDGAGNPLGTVNAFETNHQGIELGLTADLIRGLFAEEKPGAQTREKDGFSIPEDIFGQPESITAPDRIVFRGIYNWSRFHFDDDPAFSNNALPGIPEHFTRFEILYEHPRGFYFGPNLEWSMKKYAVDMNQTLFAYPYALLGLKGGYRMKSGLSFFIEAKNLTDEIYASATGVMNDARGIDSAQFLPGDGRNIIAGVEFRWG